ncbi:MAG: hypothetical protein AB1597_02295 [Chloroflexota bacterium]
MTPIEDMRALVRRDLKDENPSAYRWTDDEVDRAIGRAVLEYSQYVPRYQKDALNTVSGQDYVDIATLTNRVRVYRVEFPIGNVPRSHQPFRVYMNHLIFMGDDVGNGNQCHVEWGKVHTIDASVNTVDAQHYHTIALGAAAYAVLAISQYTIDRSNIGGEDVDMDYLDWGNAMLNRFHKELARIARRLGDKRMISGEIYYKEGA